MASPLRWRDLRNFTVIEAPSQEGNFRRENIITDVITSICHRFFLGFIVVLFAVCHIYSIAKQSSGDRPLGKGRPDLGAVLPPPAQCLAPHHSRCTAVIHQDPLKDTNRKKHINYLHCKSSLY